MKGLILCAGYATRMYPLTKDTPKALLSVGGKPALEHILNRIVSIPEIDKIYIISNARFLPLFQEWLPSYQDREKICIISDGTLADVTKLGAIGDIQHAIDTQHINDDLLIVAGDNLFTFDINEFISFFKQHGSCVAVRDEKDIECLKNYNEVELDEDMCIVAFREKPEKPMTTLSAICMYILPKHTLHLINTYLKQGHNPDQPGRYIMWLHRRRFVYGYRFSGEWYDIGNLEQYKHVKTIFEKKLNSR